MRSNALLVTPQVAKSITYHSPVYLATKLFNCLPLSLREMQNTALYKKQLKKWIKENVIPNTITNA